MPKKAPLGKNTMMSPVESVHANAKTCEQCGAANTFKRVKCEQCGHMLPEGNFERSRRMREQSLRRERQTALTSTLFRDRPLVPDDSDDVGEADPATRKGKTGAPTDATNANAKPAADDDAE